MVYKGIKGIFWGLLCELVVMIVSFVLIVFQINLKISQNSLIYVVSVIPANASNIIILCALLYFKNTNKYIKKAILFQTLRLSLNIVKALAEYFISAYPLQTSAGGRAVSLIGYVLNILVVVFIFYCLASIAQENGLSILSNRLKKCFYPYIFWPIWSSILVALPLLIQHNFTQLGTKIDGLFSYAGWGILISSCYIITAIFAWGYILYCVHFLYKQLNEAVRPGEFPPDTQE